MDLFQRIALGVVFLAAVLALIRWKRPTLWGKLTGLFKKKAA
jgi:hypothetical protein